MRSITSTFACLVVAASLAISPAAIAGEEQRSSQPQSGASAPATSSSTLDTSDPWSWMQRPLHTDTSDPWTGGANPLPPRHRAPLDTSDPWDSHRSIQQPVTPRPAVAPRSAAERALREQVKAAVDAGDLDRAAELLRLLRERTQH
jgi:hypothetical protein